MLAPLVQLHRGRQRFPAAGGARRRLAAAGGAFMRFTAGRLHAPAMLLVQSTYHV
jgi:hypothetical protein